MLTKHCMRQNGVEESRCKCIRTEYDAICRSLCRRKKGSPESHELPFYIANRMNESNVVTLRVVTYRRYISSYSSCRYSWPLFIVVGATITFVRQRVPDPVLDIFPAKCRWSILQYFAGDLQFTLGLSFVLIQEFVDQFI